MSTPMPAGPRPGMPTWLKWVLGLTVGCFLLVIACCVGTCLLGQAAFGDLFGKLQHAEEQQALARAAEDRIDTVELEFPPRIPEDVATAELTDEDVSRYLRVRTALQPQAKAFQDVIAGAAPVGGGALGVARSVVGMLGASLEAASARKELLVAAEPALRAEGMGPTDLSRLAEIVEWRFLQRPEALFLGLPEGERRQYQQMLLEEQMIAAWTSGEVPPGLKVNDRTKREAEDELRALRERIAAMQQRARQATALSGATLAVLQARRADLEALQPDGLQAMAPLTAEPAIVSFRGGERGIVIGREGTWGSPRADRDAPEPDAPAADEPAADEPPALSAGEPEQPGEASAPGGASAP